MGGTNKMGENEANLIYGREQAPGNLLERMLNLGVSAFSGGMGGGGGGSGAGSGYGGGYLR